MRRQKATCHCAVQIVRSVVHIVELRKYSLICPVLMQHQIPRGTSFRFYSISLNANFPYSDNFEITDSWWLWRHKILHTYTINMWLYNSKTNPNPNRTLTLVHMLKYGMPICPQTMFPSLLRLKLPQRQSEIAPYESNTIYFRNLHEFA